jgi:hypothetical protein
VILGPFLAMAGAIAAIWSVFKYQTVYHALINSFPLQFQDPLNSRYAFPVIALSPSTPLSLQADFVKALAGFCFAIFCLSLCFFSFQQVTAGCLFLAVFLASVLSTVKSWIAYKANCRRPPSHEDKEEP